MHNHQGLSIFLLVATMFIRDVITMMHLGSSQLVPEKKLDGENRF